MGCGWVRVKVTGDSLHQEIFASNKLLVFPQGKQKRKYGDIGSWHNIEVTFPLSSLVPRCPNLFNCTREKRGSLVKLITCVTSGGTDFHIWAHGRAGSSYSVQGTRDRRSRSLVSSHPDLFNCTKDRGASGRGYASVDP